MKEIIFLFLFGWLCGALVNYFSDILPAKRVLTAPVCVHCFETQPLIHYLIWPRRCAACQKRRPIRTWVVELFYSLSAVWLWQNPPERLGFAWGLFLLVYFGVVFVIDLEHRLIMHIVSISGAVICFGLGIGLHGWIQTFIGGVAGFLIMLGLYYLGDVFARWLARRRGENLNEVALGFGDVNLSGVLGLLLGWPGIVAGLILAILLGGIFSFIYLVIMLVFRRYQAFTAIPYGPFLVGSVILLLYFSFSF